MNNLAKLSEFIRKRNEIEREITEIIGRPAAIGHLGEFIAAHVFDIELARSASEKSLDGWFRSGPLAGRSVDVKWYTRQDGLLNITPKALSDLYLVLAGPRVAAMSSRGMSRPWLIESVYLFEAKALAAELGELGVKLGIATSVRRRFWEQAEVYPEPANRLLPLNEEQRRLLALFGHKPGY